MISQTNSYKYKIVANGITLDVFDNESIKISNNITELFDIGTLPAEITNNIDIPGSKNNNDFFKHYYDISISSPLSYTTNKKINCHIETDGIYVMQGYLVLNYLNLTNNVVESYNISIYSNLSLFASVIKNKYLSDLTTLNEYNHNLTLTNITDSWDYKLFEGEIIYPLADYGQKIFYSNGIDGYGIDENAGALSVQDFKPSMKVITIFDRIFSESGYTYESNFLKTDYLSNAYMFLNKSKRYPIFDGIDLENYGCFTIKPPKVALQQTMTNNVDYKLIYYNIENNTSGKIVNNNNTNLYYTIDKDTILRGQINLNFKIYDITSGNGVPHFSLILKNANRTYTIPLTKINDYMDKLHFYYIDNNQNTSEETYTLLEDFFTSTKVVADTNYEFYLKYTYTYANNFKVMIDADDSPTSYLTINKLLNMGDDKEVIITKQFPEITQYDFVKSLQKKFNLIIYQSKTVKNHFIIDTFNNWYKRNKTFKFDDYIDLDSTIKITPANNLALKTLTFRDKQDNDYISKKFKEGSNREYGTETYDDVNNNYSSEELSIETSVASSPLTYVSNSIVSETDFDLLQLQFNLGYLSVASGNIFWSKINIFSIYGNPLYNNNGDFYVGVKAVYKKGADYKYKNINQKISNGVQSLYVGTDYYYTTYDNGTNDGYVFYNFCITSLPAFCTLKSDTYYTLC